MDNHPRRNAEATCEFSLQKSQSSSVKGCVLIPGSSELMTICTLATGRRTSVRLRSHHLRESVHQEYYNVHHFFPRSQVRTIRFAICAFCEAAPRPWISGKRQIRGEEQKVGTNAQHTENDTRRKFQIRQYGKEDIPI